MKKSPMPLFVLGVLASLASAQSTAPARIEWQHDARQAWQASTATGRPLLVFATMPGCRYCVQMERDTLANANIVNDVNGAFVPLAVDQRTAGRLMQDLRIQAFPTTLVISPDGTVIDRIDGFVSSRELATRLARARVQLAYGRQ